MVDLKESYISQATIDALIVEAENITREAASPDQDYFETWDFLRPSKTVGFAPAIETTFETKKIEAAPKTEPGRLRQTASRVGTFVSHLVTKTYADLHTPAEAKPKSAKQHNKLSSQQKNALTSALVLALSQTPAINSNMPGETFRVGQGSNAAVEAKTTHIILDPATEAYVAAITPEEKAQIAADPESFKQTVEATQQAAQEQYNAELWNYAEAKQRNEIVKIMHMDRQQVNDQLAHYIAAGRIHFDPVYLNDGGTYDMQRDIFEGKIDDNTARRILAAVADGAGGFTIKLGMLNTGHEGCVGGAPEQNSPSEHCSQPDEPHQGGAADYGTLPGVTTPLDTVYAFKYKYRDLFGQNDMIYAFRPHGTNMINDGADCDGCFGDPADPNSTAGEHHHIHESGIPSWQVTEPLSEAPVEPTPPLPAIDPEAAVIAAEQELAQEQPELLEEVKQQQAQAAQEEQERVEAYIETVEAAEAAAQQPLEVFKEAVKGLESGGDPNIENEYTEAHGYFQITPDNWDPWSIEAFGQVVEKTPENQEAVAKFKMEQYYQQFGSWDLVAVAWFAGSGRAEAIAAGDTSIWDMKDAMGTTVRQYVDIVKANMAQLGMPA